MCKLFGYCCSLLVYAIASVGLFGLKLYVDCQESGSWAECQLDTCEKQFMWYDLMGCMVFIGPIVSVMSMCHCGFNWWKLLSFGIASTITICQVMSVCGCCLTRKRAKKDGKKSKKKKEKDDKKEPLNTECEV